MTLDSFDRWDCSTSLAFYLDRTKSKGECPKDQDQDHGLWEPPNSFAGAAVDRAEMFRYLGAAMNAPKNLTAAIDTLCKAAKRAMFGAYSQ